MLPPRHLGVDLPIDGPGRGGGRERKDFDGPKGFIRAVHLLGPPGCGNLFRRVGPGPGGGARA